MILRSLDDNEKGLADIAMVLTYTWIILRKFDFAKKTRLNQTKNISNANYCFPKPKIGPKKM